MLFLRIFRHLLPSGKAWRLAIDRPLKRLFNGLTDLGSEAKQFIDLVWLDIFPETTRELDAYEQQFGLPSVGLTDAQRRSRLAATWKALGGQSPSYIQGVLRDNGFDVYVHEWWVPGTEPAIGSHACATPRNPLVYIRREFTGAMLGPECGELLAACGEATALCGNTNTARGYPLVNRILRTAPDILPLCGEAVAACGEPEAECGNYSAFRTEYENYIVPLDPAYWAYFLYIGGPTINDIAQVDPSRRHEFEALCLKICPAQQWLGILVEYT